MTLIKSYSKTHFFSYRRLTIDHLLHHHNYHQCETTREKLLESARHATALESSQSELQQELQTIDAFGKQAVARAAKADADYHAYRVNLDGKLEKAHQEHAKELRAKVVEDAELEKSKTDNANLEEQMVAMRSQLEKALEGHDLGDEFKALHAQVTALQLEASDFNVVKTELEHQVEAAELKWERDEERISRQQVEIGRAKQGESGQELAIAAKEAKEAAQRQRIEELESQLKVKIREATDLSAEVDRLDLANTATGSARLGIDQSTNALRTRVAKLEADAVEHAQQQDHLQDEATKSMAKAKSSELQIKLLEAELTGSVAQVKSMEDHAEADLNAHSAQSDATGREKEAREAAEESTVELRGLLASLRGEKDAVTQHCRELEAKLVDVYGGNDEAKKEALAVHMAELTDVKAERAHLEAEVAHLHDVAGEQEDKLASSASELQNAIAGRGRLALALKKKDREAAAAAAKADHLSERLTLVEDEYHKAIEDHASVQVKQRMAASKAKAKARSEAGEPMSPLSPRSTNAGMSPFGMGRLSSLASRARTKSRERADQLEASDLTDAEHKSREVVNQETELVVAKMDAARAKVADELKAANAVKDANLARADAADAKARELEESVAKQIEEVRGEYAAKLKAQVHGEADLAKLQSHNKALSVRYEKIKEQLAKALDEHEMGSEVVGLHEEIIHAEEAKTAAEHIATTKSLEVDELAKRVERVKRELAQQTADAAAAQAKLAALEPTAAAAQASNTERARRIEELERQHQAKARECLSFAAEKATSSIQRTSKDGASDRLLAQATTANETLQNQLSSETERLRLSEQHLHDLKLQVRGIQPGAHHIIFPNVISEAEHNILILRSKFFPHVCPFQTTRY